VGSKPKSAEARAKFFTARASGARNGGATATALPGPIGWRRCGPAGHDPASWPMTRRRGITWSRSCGCAGRS
jgi:hypothetical protein